MKSLPCDQTLLLLSDWLAGEISPEDAEQVEAHLAGCPSCRELAGEYGRLDRLLAELAIQVKVPRVLADIRTALANETPLPTPALLDDEWRDGRLEKPDGVEPETLAKARQPGKSQFPGHRSTGSNRKITKLTVSFTTRRGWLIAGASTAAAVVLGVIFWPRGNGTGPTLPVARLEQFQGDVFILTQEGGRLPAKTGQQIFESQGLAVGEEGRAIVDYPDATRLELIGETTVRSFSDSRAAESGAPAKGKTVLLDDGLL
ncbi:MAG: zf-HC2 domain-containing protein, partial [Planctomycetaceae bacterium]|nr:zf-HC2 domain-containing protein [Planctomycetaceae bacterium]